MLKITNFNNMIFFSFSVGHKIRFFDGCLRFWFYYKQRNTFKIFSVVLPFLNVYTEICLLVLDCNCLLWISSAAVLICASLLCFRRDFSQCSAHVSGRNCSEESPGLPRTRAQHLHLHRSVHRSDPGTPWGLGQGGSLPFYFWTLDCLSLLWTSQINLYILNFCCCNMFWTDLLLLCFQSC